ncbi:hypothetical protein ACOJIV_20580 [Haloarcula sp. AONF1]
MSRGTAADNSFTPVETERLFQTASRLDERALRDDLQHASVTIAFLVYFLGYLGFRLGFALHFTEEDVVRDAAGEIVAVTVPYHKDCHRAFEEAVCSHCRTLAKARARNADDDAEPEDFYDDYWSPKSHAGGRQIPVLQERGRDIIERFLEAQGQLDMTDETVRRRLTRLAEVTEGIDPDRMMPQSLRASAANYWIMLDKFDNHGLKMLMGWKYLSTAQYYVSSEFAQLWHKMSAALGKSTDGPYDVDAEPETYATIRENADLIALDRITPQGDVARHKYDHLPDPLEAEARERQQTFGAFADEHEAPAASDPASAWARARLLLEHGAAKASDQVDYPPSLRTVGTLAVALAAWAVFAGVVWGTTGAFYIDPVTGDVHATPGAAIGLFLGLAFIVREVPEL